MWACARADLARVARLPPVVIKSLDLQDALAFAALGKESILTLGSDHIEPDDLEAMWKQRLSETSKLRGMGWTTTGKRGTSCWRCHPDPGPAEPPSAPSRPCQAASAAASRLLE
jgi:hypothetical protein